MKKNIIFFLDNLMSYITVNLIEDFCYSAWEKKILFSSFDWRAIKINELRQKDYLNIQFFFWDKKVESQI